ncbi:protein of unknown function [Cupriavidus taiwanensis]|nr:protein of unknown function [Cupriavidus taiwanensis]
MWSTCAFWSWKRRSRWPRWRAPRWASRWRWKWKAPAALPASWCASTRRSARARAASWSMCASTCRQKLRAGMFARGALVLGQRAAVVAVPVSAVRTEGERAFVYASSATRWRNARCNSACATKPADGRNRRRPRRGAEIVRNNLGTLRSGSQVRRVRPDGTQDARHVVHPPVDPQSGAGHHDDDGLHRGGAILYQRLPVDQFPDITFGGGGADRIPGRAPESVESDVSARSRRSSIPSPASTRSFRTPTRALRSS